MAATIIDATNLIMGRLASDVARRALRGEDIIIVNVEKTVITGSKKDIFAGYVQRRERKRPVKGPFFPTKSEYIMRRTIRGMLPYKQAKGIIAYKRIKCFVGLPPEYSNSKIETIKSADVSKTKSFKYITLAEVSKLLGGKV